MTVGDVLDGIFQLLRACAGPIMLILLVVVWPDLLLREVLLGQLAPALQTLDPDLLVEAYLDNAGWVAGNALLGLFIGVVVGGALIALAGSSDRGQRLSTGGALKVGLVRSGSTFGASVLTLLVVAAFAIPVGILSALALLLNVFVGVIVMLPSFAFLTLAGFALSELVIVAAIEEGVGPGRALVRSLSLLRRSFWRILGITALVLLLLVAIFAALFLLSTLLSGIMGSAGWIIEVLTGVLFAAVATPITALTGFLVHRDARVRLEGYDLQIRAGELRGGVV